jgi:hypothetical protein
MSGGSVNYPATGRHRPPGPADSLLQNDLQGAARDAICGTRLPSGELSHVYWPDSRTTGVTGKNADVTWVGCQDNPPARGCRRGDDDCIDSGSRASHSGEALEPGRRAGDRLGERNNLEPLEHLVSAGVTLITKECLGQNRCRDKDRNVGLT